MSTEIPPGRHKARYWKAGYKRKHDHKEHKHFLKYAKGSYWLLEKVKIGKSEIDEEHNEHWCQFPVYQAQQYN